MSTIKKLTGIAGSLFLAVGLLAACSDDTAKKDNQGTQQKTEQPTISADFVQDGNTVTINWSTNITVSADNYGGEHVDGEGHAHVYVDGEKVAGLKNTDAYVVEGLSAGKHTIEIVLQRNNHVSYEVSKSFEVEVTEEVADEVAAPTLDAVFVQEGNNVTIEWDTNLAISAENYGGEHVDGEGHAHVYVDGEKVAGLKNTDEYVVTGLSAGKHTIEIALQRNDHQAYEVSKSIEVEVKNPSIATALLDANFTLNGNNVTIDWSTNLLISAEHYGADHVIGEGHAHVYVDGEKVAGLKNTEDYVVKGLSAGMHQIEIALQQNDHTPYNISAIYIVEVK